MARATAAEVRSIMTLPCSHRERLEFLEWWESDFVWDYEADGELRPLYAFESGAWRR